MMNRRAFLKGMAAATISLAVAPSLVLGGAAPEAVEYTITNVETLIDPRNFGYTVRGLAVSSDGKKAKYFMVGIDEPNSENVEIALSRIKEEIQRQAREGRILRS